MRIKIKAKTLKYLDVKELKYYFGKFKNKEIEKKGTIVYVVKEKT